MADGIDTERGREAPSILLPHQDAEYVSHIAIDIGGSLVKLVYFLPDEVITAGLLQQPDKHTGGTASLLHPNYSGFLLSSAAVIEYAPSLFLSHQ